MIWPIGLGQVTPHIWPGACGKHVVCTQLTAMLRRFPQFLANVTLLRVVKRISLKQGTVVATRNAREFEPLGVSVVDPLSCSTQQS